MSLVRVKICGLTRREDVEAVVDAGADAIGLVFVPGSARCVSIDQARLLCDRVPAFVTRVGLFLDAPAATVREVLQQVPLNLLQFHGNEPALFCRGFGMAYIKALPVGDKPAMQAFDREYVDAAGALVDAHSVGGLGGTGQRVDWSRVSPGSKPLILAGGLAPDNVAEAIRMVRPWAVDVSSGVESAPGIKDATAVRRFISEAKS